MQTKAVITYLSFQSSRLARWGRVVLFLTMLLSTLGLALPAAPAQGQAAPVARPVPSAAQDFAPAVVLVGLKPGAEVESVLAQPAQGNGALSAMSASTTEVLRAEPVFAFAQKAKPGVQAMQTVPTSSAASRLARIYRLRLSPGSDVQAAVAALVVNSNVEFAEPDYVMRGAGSVKHEAPKVVAPRPTLYTPLLAVPNDPQYADQWGLSKIGAPAAWDVTTGISSTIIAIVDSGLDAEHEDLAGKVWTNSDEIAGNGVDDDGNGLIDDVHGWNFVEGNNDLTDVNGHGTEVAGVAGAASDNNLGIAGVCWNCRLMVVKVMQSSGIVNYSDVAAGVAYAAGEGANIINLSLGGYADSTTLRTAIESAAQTAVVVAGAGNDNKSALFYPAAYSSVLAVAATDASNVKASFSNYGSWVDVAAPGVNVLTTFAGGNSYGNQNGTSLSAPIVAGVAGLVLSQHPDWSAGLVREHLLNTATFIDGVNPTFAGKLGRGLINANSAVSLAAQPQMTATGWALDGQANARPDKNKTYALAVTLMNTWLPARGVVGTLSTAVSGVTIGDASGAFGDINTDQSKTNSVDTFSVTFGNSLSYGQLITFTLNLSGADGYSLSVPVVLQVRSGVVTWPGNATIITNTTWYADQMYVITTTVKVNPGVTLTIQPGTVVRSNISGTLRIDGTLIAQGTADKPIVFLPGVGTTITGTVTTQGGALNFVGTSVQSTWDANGQYVSGSVLQHIDMTGWNIGLNSRALSIADSAFNGGTITGGTNTPTVIEAGASHIERDVFTSGAAIVMYGGQSLIRDNIFTGGAGSALNLNGGTMRIEGNTVTNYSGAIYGSGAHTIISNTFANNTGTAIYLGSWSPVGGVNAPIIHDNYIVGNACGAIEAAGLLGVDIEHNLIANNGVAGVPPCANVTAVALDVQNNNNSQSSPALAYSPDRDEYLLVWSESSGTNNQIKAQRVLSDGQMSGAVINVGLGYLASVVYNPTQQEYMVAGSGGAMGMLTVQRMSQGGTLIGNASIITTSMTDNFRVIHQSADNTYLVVWQDMLSRIYARRVLTDGTLSGDVIPIGMDVSSVSMGDVAYDPISDKSLVVFRGDVPMVWTGSVWLPGCSGCVLGQWITATTPLTPTSFILADSSQGFLSNPGLAFGENVARYFAAWERDNSGRQVYGQVIMADGALSFSQTVAYTETGWANGPRVGYAPSNDSFLAVWAQRQGAVNEQVLGRRVLTDGVTAGSAFPIASWGGGGGMGLSSVALAHNSARNEYLIAWVDSRSGTNMIYGQRLSADGQLLDNAWTTADETNPAVNFQLTSAKGVRYNTIFNNKGYGVQVSGSAAGQVVIAHNNLIGNATYDVYLPSGTQNMTVTATSNYWGVDATSIPGRIHDCEFDDPNGCAQTGSVLGKVAYDPPLDAPAPEAPGYISAVTIAPSNGAPGDPIGIGRATVEVNFSRPMVTTTLPTVSFHDVRRETVETVDASIIMLNSMGQDVMGRMWFGTGYNGVRMFDGTNWVTYTTSSGLGNNYVTAILGASNGDVWFGHPNSIPGEAQLSRLQGLTWITYTSQPGNNVYLSGVQAIAEDATGKMWFGGQDGAVSFDGNTWRRYTTTDGLANNSVMQIVRDGLGRMWFRTGALGSLSVFDGITWTTYNQSNGLPVGNSIMALFADRQGRIWIGLMGGMGQPSVGMFDGVNWTFYGSAETNGYLTFQVGAFAEDLDGTIWMTAYNTVVTYDGSQWATRSNLSNVYSPIAFDSRGNLWMGGSGLRVLWGGADYSVVDNAQWLSPAHYRATYDVTPIIPKGTYVINASGAQASDGMLVAPHTTQTFLVDYAGFVTDGTPPTRPVVNASSDGSLTTLSFNWSSTDAESGIDQYRYAIGTTSGGRDVVEWTYLGKTTTSVARNGLLLQRGQTYYVTVAARNAQGLWSQNGVSNPVVAGTPTELTYSISGRVLNNQSQPIPGVTIGASSGASATTDASGYYTLTNVISGTYTLTPSKSGYSFSPLSRMITVPPNATNQGFTGTPIAGTTYSISGRVTDGVNPIAGVSLSIGAGGSATTDASGYYTITNVASGSYTLVPSKNGYTFSPLSRAVSVPPDATNQNFVGTVNVGPTYSIAGRVVNNTAQPMLNVLVASSSGGAAYTDASGYYTLTLTGLISGTYSYTLTPTLSGYTFSPVIRTVSVPPSQTGQDFVGTSKKFVFLPLVIKN